MLRPVMAAATLWVALVLAAPVAAAPSADPLAPGARFERPVDLAYLAPPPVVAALSGHFEGRLTLELAGLRLSRKVLRDETGDTAAERLARATLPPFDFAFVQDGAALIPVRRGPVASGHPVWEWVLEPGRVWPDLDHPGWLRASVPFALQERNANCLHNGVLAFRFRPDGQASPVALEIASETCAYLKFDAWGLIPARLTPAPVEGADAVVAAYREEVAARLPIRPIAELAGRYPGLDIARLALARPADGDPPAAFGLVVDGVHYAGPCQTRHGDYPFCAVLDLPSYSTAKSIVGGVGLMRLEALRPGATAELIRDHVPACAVDQTWSEVTLGHALDMATGIYGSRAYEVDENAADMLDFFEAADHAAKVAYACGRHPRRTSPGQTFLYHTTDTYLLGAAMSDVLRRESLGDLYADLIAPLWRSLRLSPSILETRRTLDGVGQPFTGWGLTYHADDIARIAGWLAGGAMIDGRPALDEGLLNAALQRDPSRPGLAAGGADYRYKAGFWARDLGRMLGCPGPLWTPFMSGYGGISVVLLPGDVTFYYFGDSGVFDWSPAAVEAARMKRMCR